MSRDRSDAPLHYESAPLPIPERLRDAHQRFWDRLRAPGAWWTGVERVAIAREVRQARVCSLCTARREALSPNGVSGIHDTATELPLRAVEAVHRIVTDPGRLTHSWFESVVGEEVTVERYVELLGTVSALLSIDEFCRATGMPLHRLPQPASGEPGHYRPAAAAADDAWVPMIPADGNVGAEADLWPRGRTGNVIRAMSLVPDEVRTLNDLSAVHYLPNHLVGDPRAHGEHLDRQQMELVAGRVSALNQCYY
jgi:hypothetical protein